MLIKVPEVTAAFWLTKALSTGMGEAASDFLANSILGPALAVPLALVALVLALRWQLRSDRYRPYVYWTAVSMVAVFGTMAADAVHLVGVPYVVSTISYALVLAGVLVAWHRSEGTLSIHTITTARRERFYWATVLATFALGTAAGDMTAASFGWGFLASGAVFAGLIALPALAAWRTQLSRVALFWTAYVLTRPLGASFADWFGKPARDSGLGCGDGTVTAVMLVAIVAMVAGLTVGARSARTASEPAPRLGGLAAAND
jgi:uncharacterized membrane-anchored protein